MKSWKRAEQRAAAKFGAKRAPLSGSNGGVTASDSLSSSCFIETKYRKVHSWVTLFHKVEEAARKEMKIGGRDQREPKFPVLILAEKGRHRLFVLAPLESGYLQILADELRREDAKRDRDQPGPRGPHHEDRTLTVHDHLQDDLKPLAERAQP